MVCLFPPLCCKLAAGLGSEGVREASGQEEVVEELILQRAMFQEMKAMQQQEEEEEEEGRALQHACPLLAAFLCWLQVGQVLDSEGLKLGRRLLYESGLCCPHCQRA